jgi:hypothetical protein
MSAEKDEQTSPASAHVDTGTMSEAPQEPASRWRRLLGGSRPARGDTVSPASLDTTRDYKIRPEKWSFGVLNDKETDEVPGNYL